MDQHALQAFLSPKRFHASFELAGRTYEIEVETPDLSGCESSMWADWGPMYTFSFSDAGRLQMTYRCEELGVEAQHELRLPRIELVSPMSWAQRQQTPFVLSFRDWERGMGFFGYLDRAGKPAVLQAKPLGPDEEIAQLLVPTPAVRSHLSAIGEGQAAYA